MGSVLRADLRIGTGFGDSKGSFLQSSAFLTEKYRVILPEVPGFGETSKVPDRDHSNRTQVETFHKFFQKLGLKEFYLGGNSMGGHISTAYALRYPNEIKRLILLNAAGLSVPGEFSYSHSEESIETEADFKDTVVSLLIDNSGSMRGRPITLAAISADIMARTLERCGVKVEILGFTTRAWKGGQSRERWLAEGKRANAGRLNDLRHIEQLMCTPVRPRRLVHGRDEHVRAD